MTNRAFIFLAIALVRVTVCSCSNGQYDIDSCKERLEGRYGTVDRRTVIEGPERGDGVFCGSMVLEVLGDGIALMSGSFNATGRVVDSNLKMDVMIVDAEDGTSLRYEFGIVESSRTLYRLDWSYTVQGTVVNDFGEEVEYRAKGKVEARRLSK